MSDIENGRPDGAPVAPVTMNRFRLYHADRFQLWIFYDGEGVRIIRGLAGTYDPTSDQLIEGDLVSRVGAALFRVQRTAQAVFAPRLRMIDSAISYRPDRDDQSMTGNEIIERAVADGAFLDLGNDAGGAGVDR